MSHPVIRHPALLAAIGLVGVFTIGLVLAYFNSRWLGLQPIQEQALALAYSGVAGNDEWRPFIQKRNLSLNMALVPAGCFMMGSTEEQLVEAQNSCDRFYGNCQIDFPASEQPAHRVCFNEPYWIGATEVTNREYGSSSQISVEMYRGPNWGRDTVTWAEAQGFCESAGLRLPTEAEWEYAARGPEALVYPWGDTYDPTYVLAGVLSPNDVGQFTDGRSWVGAYDLSGGMAEWVADWYAPYPAQEQIDPQGPAEGGQRIVRGGSWFSFASFLVRTAHRSPQDPDFTNGVTGFRCAGDFE